MNVSIAYKNKTFDEIEDVTEIRYGFGPSARTLSIDEVNSMSFDSKKDLYFFSDSRNVLVAPNTVNYINIYH